MQSIILSNFKLEQIISELTGETTTGTFDFCEDMEVDYIEWEKNVLVFDEIISLLNTHYNIKITSYVPIDLDNNEFGFAFNF